jgi:hypothetical protein
MYGRALYTAIPLRFIPYFVSQDYYIEPRVQDNIVTVILRLKKTKSFKEDARVKNLSFKISDNTKVQLVTEVEFA